MKTKVLLLITALLFMLIANGQQVNLTFTAIDSATYVQSDSIKIMNRTHGGDTIIHWPDTMLVLDYTVGIPYKNIDVGSFKVFQNYPNPSADNTTISLFIPEKDKVKVIVTDILGREILKSERELERGTHYFRFTPGGENLYFFTAQWRGGSSSIEILHSGFNSGGQCSLEYTGSEALPKHLKAAEDIQSFTFSPGDELLYICYADSLESGIIDKPKEDSTYTFQFATNIPCPGTPTVEYEGQIYNTIQIFSQCWLKENLNVGSMIQGDQEMIDNGVIEKYCYNNEPDSCTKYGGLYQWYEMMQYTIKQGTQGICPPGWHLPTDEEWKVLEGAVDSQYGIGDNTWDGEGYRGFDAGLNLKTTNGWSEQGNGTDKYGFSGLPGGTRATSVVIFGGYFGNAGIDGFWWTSAEGSIFDAWYRYLYYYYPGVYRYFDPYHDLMFHNYKAYGYSARCLRDY